MASLACGMKLIGLDEINKFLSLLCVHCHLNNFDFFFFHFSQSHHTHTHISGQYSGFKYICRSNFVILHWLRTTERHGAASLHIFGLSSAEWASRRFVGASSKQPFGRRSRQIQDYRIRSTKSTRQSRCRQLFPSSI